MGIIANTGRARGNGRGKGREKLQGCPECVGRPGGLGCQDQNTAAQRPAKRLQREAPPAPMSATTRLAPGIGKQPSYRAEEMQLNAQQLLGENADLRSQLEVLQELLKERDYEVAELTSHLTFSEEYGNQMRDRAEHSEKQLETCGGLHDTREQALRDRIDGLLLNRVPAPPWAKTHASPPPVPRGPSPSVDAPGVSPFPWAAEKRTDALHLPRVIRAAIPADVKDKDAYAAYLLGPPPSGPLTTSGAPLEHAAADQAAQGPLSKDLTFLYVCEMFYRPGALRTLTPFACSEAAYVDGCPDGTTSSGACESDDDPFDADEIDALAKQLEREQLADLLATDEYSEA